MTRSERNNWLINIENTAAEVAANVGQETVDFVPKLQEETDNKALVINSNNCWPKGLGCQKKWFAIVRIMIK